MKKLARMAKGVVKFSGAKHIAEASAFFGLLLPIMDLSVIIINYNTFSLTSACIASVLEKTEGLVYEIILVDNASTECDAEEFKRLYPRIKLIKSPTNTGFAGGNNLGLAEAEGKYILLLNSDTELLNNALYFAWRIMEAEPAIGVLSGQLQYPDGRLQHPAGHYPSIGLELAQLFRVFKFLPSAMRRRWYLSDQWNHHLDTDADWVWGAFFMTRRYVLDQLPGKQLPADFFMYGEDMQWCRAIQNLGYRIHYNSGPKCVHHIGGSETQTQAAEDRELTRLLPNQYKLLTHWHGTWYPLIYYISKGLLYWSAGQKARAQKLWSFAWEQHRKQYEVV